MATCRQCGEPIEWRKTRAKKWRPHDANGEVHYGTCKRVQLGESPNADYFPSHGVERAGDTQNAPQHHPVSGRKYWEGGKKTGRTDIPEHCCPEVPPWEFCEHQASRGGR